MAEYLIIFPVLSLFLNINVKGLNNLYFIIKYTGQNQIMCDLNKPFTLDLVCLKTNEPRFTCKASAVYSVHIQLGVNINFVLNLLPMVSSWTPRCLHPSLYSQPSALCSAFERLCFYFHRMNLCFNIFSSLKLNRKDASLHLAPALGWLIFHVHKHIIANISSWSCSK